VFLCLKNWDKLKMNDLNSAMKILKTASKKHKLEHKYLVHFSCVYIYILD
jgi:hypothetical protein